MLTSGDVVVLDLGVPAGREAGFSHPAVVMTAQRILDADPAVVHVVPLTSTVRGFHSEIAIAADDDNGLDLDSVGQCQHLRAVSRTRIAATRGNVGPSVLAQLRETVAVLLDLPGGRCSAVRCGSPPRLAATGPCSCSPETQSQIASARSS